MPAAEATSDSLVLLVFFLSGGLLSSTTSPGANVGVATWPQNRIRGLEVATGAHSRTSDLGFIQVGVSRMAREVMRDRQTAGNVDRLKKRSS